MFSGKIRLSMLEICICFVGQLFADTISLPILHDTTTAVKTFSVCSFIGPWRPTTRNTTLPLLEHSVGQLEEYEHANGWRNVA